MKKLIIPALLLILTSFSSCLKGPKCSYNPCNIVAPASEVQAVQAYLTNNNITGTTQHCSGMFYKIEAGGTGKTPEACASISVTYIGSMSNGTVFDQSATPINFNLGSLIAGWKNGLPLIKEGGRIKLYLPPTLGYGDQQAGPIPPNSILIFDISLVTVY